MDVNDELLDRPSIESGKLKGHCEWILEHFEADIEHWFTNRRHQEPIRVCPLLHNSTFFSHFIICRIFCAMGNLTLAVRNKRSKGQRLGQMSCKFTFCIQNTHLSFVQYSNILFIMSQITNYKEQ
jgi:hypothetical protein